MKQAYRAEDWVRLLGLKPHPEGGFYRETYRSPGLLSSDALPAGFHGATPYATAILFLLTRGSFSAFHRIASDELWHFHAGDPLEVHVLEKPGRHRMLLLGPDPLAGQSFQACVEARAWFSARLAGGGHFALVGCTVAPGFCFEDFELAGREALAAEFPAHRELVYALTRG